MPPMVRFVHRYGSSLELKKSLDRTQLQKVLPKICAQSSSDHQADDKAGPGSDLSALRADKRKMAGKLCHMVPQVCCSHYRALFVDSPASG
ncbi:hypothetical protein CgunFtcFv8_006427 [Champsocephalus gunnari]|uniref:Uncharacterized protein n=1 Tax=Champsocephalus gunnari TaxID=52237 RepID=A0AAN8BX94_CHAGU|nr:hypothetical protein CgunFtcFv8_006427 [Champsocephalus gunnari]